MRLAPPVLCGSGMKIRDIMRPGPFTIEASDVLGVAYVTMKRSNIRHLPVVSDGKLVGMLSERDVLAARARADAKGWYAIPVRDAMSAPVETAAPGDPLSEVEGRMAVAKIGAMPVVEGDTLVGLATIQDVLVAEVRAASAPAPIVEVTAVDVMTPWPRTIAPEATLTDAAAVMLAHHVRHLPVVDGASNVVGMLSDRDLRTAIGDPVQYVELRARRPDSSTCVKDAMSRPAVVVPYERPLLELARSFADDRLGAVLVVDGFGALLGIVSYVDVLRVLTA